MTTLEARSEAAPAASGDGAGARLRAARETAGLSLDQAAQQLKLAPRQVRALEEEDFAHLPGRTFTRGFMRNYARLLNLDPEDVLALMPDATHAPALDASALQSTGAMIAELPTSSERGPGLARWMIPLVLVACVVAAAGFEWYRGGLSNSDEAAHSSSAPAKPAVSNAARTTAISSTPLPNPLVDTPKLESAPASASVAPSAMPATPASREQTASESATAPTAAVQAAPASDASAPLQLVYGGPSWTEVRDRDGQVLIARLVPAGSEQAIRGTAPFDLVIGNAASVWLTYRGQPVDLAPYTRQNVARLRLS